MTPPEYSISVLCHNRADFTRRCLDSVLRYSPEAIEILVTDNGSRDATPPLLRDYAARDPRIKVTTNGENLGITRPKRRACERAAAPLFVSLDNDAWVGAGWLDALRAPLDADPHVAQVGRAGQHQHLLPNGIGAPGGELEYIDGSCFMTRTQVARDMGLCDLFFPFCYGDDSDYSLRLRARGWEIATVPVDVQHPHERDKLNHGGVDVREHLRTAQERLHRRWGDYLRRRAFDPTVAIRRTAALGDVVLATALVRATKELWPASRIFFATDVPEVFAGNPYVEQVVPAHEYPALARRMAYAWDLDGAYERRLSRNYLDAYFATAVFAEGPPRPSPELYPMPEATDQAAALVPVNGKPLAVVAPQLTTWHGKNLPPEAWVPAVRELRRRGYAVAEVGTGEPLLGRETDYAVAGRTTLPALAALLGRAKLFLGLEAGPAHIANAMGAVSVVFYGCTTPDLVAGSAERTVPVTAHWLDCLGCHHRQPDTTRFMGCPRGDFACLGVAPEAIVSALDEAERIAWEVGR